MPAKLSVQIASAFDHVGIQLPLAFNRPALCAATLIWSLQLFSRLCRLPFASHALAFGSLLRSQGFLKYPVILFGYLNTFGSSKQQPHVCPNLVLRHALAKGILHPKNDLRHGITLLGTLAIPFHCFDRILGDALASVIHESKAHLRHGIPLNGSLAKLLHRLHRILGDASALGIRHSKDHLRLCITLIGSLTKPLCRLRRILGDL